MLCSAGAGIGVGWGVVRLEAGAMVEWGLDGSAARQQFGEVYGWGGVGGVSSLGSVGLQKECFHNSMPYCYSWLLVLWVANLV